MGRARARSSRSIPGATWSPRRSPTRSPRASTSARPSPSPRRTLNLPEMQDAIAAGRLQARRRRSCTPNGDVRVTKIAIDPVWYLPGIAERFGVEESRPAPHAVRADRRHVSRAGDAARSRTCSCRRSAASRSISSATSPSSADPTPGSPAACTTSATAPTCSAPTSAPAGPISCTASRSASRGAAGRRRAHRLQSQGRPRARRGHQVPGLQRPQAPGRRRPAAHLFRAHRMRRRRAGRALPAADAGRAPLARHHAHRPLRVDEQHEVRRAARAGHRDRRARADPRRADPGRRAGRDGGQEGRRLLHAAEPRNARPAKPPGAAALDDRRNPCGTSVRAALVASPRSRHTPVPARIRRRRCCSAAAVRAPRAAMLASAERGQTAAYFRWRSRAARRRGRTTCSRRRGSAYPDLDVPFHARWRHFVADGRRSLGAHRGTGWPADDAPSARARRIDLAIVSVLLDAGAGPAGAIAIRRPGRASPAPKGLGWRASRMFAAGAFSSRPRGDRCASMPRALASLDAADARRRASRSRADNPLVGLEGRAALLRRLGAVVAATPAVFGTPARPAGLFDHLVAHARGRRDRAPDSCWPRCCARWARSGRRGRRWAASPLGDCWRHPAIAPRTPTTRLVPFHKLSQWLSYSLIEPLQEAGIAVTDIDGLTGLAEYRNGGLLRRHRRARAARRRTSAADARGRLGPLSSNGAR